MESYLSRNFLNWRSCAKLSGPAILIGTILSPWNLNLDLFGVHGLFMDLWSFVVV
jgi:hypothetical protein